MLRDTTASIFVSTAATLTTVSVARATSLTWTRKHAHVRVFVFLHIYIHCLTFFLFFTIPQQKHALVSWMFDLFSYNPLGKDKQKKAFFVNFQGHYNHVVWVTNWSNHVTVYERYNFLPIVFPIFLYLPGSLSSCSFFV